MNKQILALTGVLCALLLSGCGTINQEHKVITGNNAFGVTPEANKPVKQQRLEAAAKRYVGARGNGRLGCALAVNRIVKDAYGVTIANNTASTAAMYETLKRSEEWVQVPLASAPAGSIVISPTEKRRGHVGILLSDGSIVSNSSGRNIILDHWNLDRWTEFYTKRRGLKTVAFVRRSA